MEAQSQASRRKQTLLSLLDALNELSTDGDILETGLGIQQPVVNGKDPVLAIEEQIQVAGAEAFSRFQRKIGNLDKELRNFASASRQLGTSVRHLSSAYDLRDRLSQILFLFGVNAAELFPRVVPQQPRQSFVVRSNPAKPKNSLPSELSSQKDFRTLSPEDFPSQLSALAADLDMFLLCLNEFPESSDEGINAIILSLEGDLRYWASCLKSYEGQFRYPEIQRYLHDLMSEMGEHIDSFTSSLSTFIEISVPAVRLGQKDATRFLNLLTVATFFSAVTASTLQCSYQTTGSALSDSVNAFWFSSMVFSVAAAVNTLLGLTWIQSMYRSPSHRLPWWVSFWMKRSPLVFLCISVTSFSVGLVLFAYSSAQSRITRLLTLIFTAFSSFGLIIVLLWIVFERWTFYRYRGKKWLGDVLAELPRDVGRILHPKRHACAALDRTNACLSYLRKLHVRWATTFFRPEIRRSDRAGHDVEREGAGSAPFYSSLLGSADPRTETSTIAVTAGTSGTPLGTMTPSAILSERSPARARWMAAVRSIIAMGGSSLVTAPIGSSAGVSVSSPRRQLSVRSSSVGRRRSDDSRENAEKEDIGPVSQPTRTAALIAQLKDMKGTHEVSAHSALVRCMQFSPNGQFLATSSWDRTSLIFKVEGWTSPHRVLAHPQGSVGQIAWSPSGTLLLTKLARGVKVWTEDGVCRRTIDRSRSIQSIAWCPGGEAFMSVENSEVVKLDLNGIVLGRHRFDQMTLHDVAVTLDDQRLLIVATLLESEDGFKPSKSRAEKRIIVYNLEKQKLEAQVPVLQDVRDITLARNGHVALVSYENKAPPQLWQLDLSKDPERLKDVPIVRLVLRHTYTPASPIDFAGPSYFGGQDDQLVLCASKVGDIHVWDRESGVLLHHFRALPAGSKLTCLAWNHAADPFMFSTGSHEGTIRLWTASPCLPDEPQVPHYRLAPFPRPATTHDLG